MTKSSAKFLPNRTEPNLPKSAEPRTEPKFRSLPSPEPRKILTTHYKFCLMEVDAKRPGEEGRLNTDTCGQGGGVKNWKILRTSCMDGPLLKNINYLLTKLPPQLFYQHYID